MNQSFPNQHQYFQQFIQRQATSSSEILGDAARFNVTLQKADVSPGDYYWRALGVHHLTPAENQGKHNVYVDVVDEDGNLMPHHQYPELRLVWGPDSDHLSNAHLQLFDKSGGEALTNVSIDTKQDSVWVRVRGMNQPADSVLHMGTNFQGAGEGTSWGHHSYYIVFQKSKAQSAHNSSGQTSAGSWSPFSVDITTDLSQILNDAMTSSEQLTPIAVAQQSVQQSGHNYAFLCNTPASPAIVYISKPLEQAAVHKKTVSVELSL